MAQRTRLVSVVSGLKNWNMEIDIKDGFAITIVEEQEKMP